jgi:hypothetical protein
LGFGFKEVGRPKITSGCRLFKTPTSQNLRSTLITKVSSLLRPGLPPLSDTNLVSGFPVSILPNESEFTCSLLKPAMKSAPLNPECGVAGNQLSATLITRRVSSAGRLRFTAKNVHLVHFFTLFRLRSFIMDSFSLHFS